MSDDAIALNPETQTPTPDPEAQNVPEPNSPNRDPEARNPEPDSPTAESGARNPEPGARNPEPGPRSTGPCRAITTAGQRCKNDALDGSHLCYSHARHRHPTLPHPTQVSIPLLEDHASVQLIATQVVHGLMSLKMAPDHARTILYALQIVAATLPRPGHLPSPNPPSSPSPQPAGGNPQSQDTQIHTITFDEFGPIAADGDQPAPNAHWSRPAPGVDPLAVLDASPNIARPDPLPPNDPFSHCDCPICRKLMRHGADPMLHRHIQPIENPHCSSGHPDCRGPESDVRCPHCEKIRKFMPLRRRHKPQPKPETPETQPDNAQPDNTQPDSWIPFDFQAAAEQPSADRHLAARVIPPAYYPPTPAESNTNESHHPGGYGQLNAER